MTAKRKRTTQKRPNKKRAFLSAYAHCGNVTRASALAKCSRTQVYEWLQIDTDFAAAFSEAGDQAVEVMEAEARRRAVDGTNKPVYQGGVKVGVIREFSDTLLIFLLKAARPEKYRDRYDHKYSGQVAVEHGGTVRVTVRDLLNEPDYLSFLRARERCVLGDAGANGEDHQPGYLANGDAPRIPGCSDNGHHHGSNGKHPDS